LFTEIVICVGFTHCCPAVGVNVYVVVAELFMPGDQEPVILLFDVVGKGDTELPEQIAGTCVNKGVTVGVTTIDKVFVAVQVADGVKVYVVVAELFIAGDQEPLTPLVDVVGNAAILAPWQIGLTELNVGVAEGLTLTATVFVKV